MRLPQISNVQRAEQPSPSAWLPSSHCSRIAMSSNPLPQISLDLQSLEQPSPSWVLPSSQTSPAVQSIMLSPQGINAHFGCFCCTSTQNSPSEHHPSPHTTP